MILSVSRRTDVPNYYSEWFYNRIKEGFLYVRNPMNFHQISRINLSPQVVDCIVFWTKNPANMIGRLEELQAYPYYFQFTLTGYGKDIEPNLPDKRSCLIDTFKRLSEEIGKEKVIWRYDPILINERYTVDYHIRAFEEIAGNLGNYTEKVIVSFVDLYAKTQRNTKNLNIQDLNGEQMMALAKSLAEIAKSNALEIETCAEQIGLEHLGIKHGSCIDQVLIEKILGCKLKVGKDKNQRKECSCIESVEVGTYDTCQNGCKYCYANFNDKKVRENISLYNVNAPLLCGTLDANDKITERKVRSFKMEIRLQPTKDFKLVTEIVKKTIQKVYPFYYPAGAVQFFLEFHSQEKVQAAMETEDVYLLMEKDTVLGTGSICGNVIGRLFILPEYQRKGYGSRLMDLLEAKIFEQEPWVMVDASFPAEDMYLKRGYQILSYEKIKTGNGDFLCYHVMKKSFSKS